MRQNFSFPDKELKIQKFFESKQFINQLIKHSKLINFMKKQYFKHLPKFKKEAVQCQKTFQEPIRQTFQRIKTNYNLLDCVKLQNLLQTQKQVRPIDDSMKKEIFKFFLQKQLNDFQFLKSRSKVSTRLLKLTKIKLEDTKLDWLSTWSRILLQFPQIPRKQNFQLQEFLKIIKIFYDQNNALDVFKYFIKKHGDHSEYVFTYILMFANITVNTKEEIFQQFLEELVECYMKAQIKPKTLLVYFINLMKKRRSAELPKERYEVLKNIILAGILTPPTKDSKSSIESKFTKENAIMVSQFIGKHNPYSMEMVKILFQVSEKFIYPFENSTKAVRFLYNLIRFVWKRTQKEKKAKIRLQKLIQRQKKLQQQKQKEKQAQKNLQTQQTASQQPKPSSQQQQPVQQDDDLNQQQQDLQSQDQKQKQQNLDQQLNEGQEELLSNQLEEKKNRCLKILKNQITEEILSAIKDGVRHLFNYVYFVNSKKTVQQFLRYSFIMLPEMIISSLDLLEKASEIPYINEQGLVMNIKITIQYMFQPSLLKDSLNNLQRVLDRIINCSKIVDVWPIYELLFAKLPLLDEKDLQKVKDQDKELFEKKFQMNHDRFYQMYSGNVYSAFKRMLRQGEFFDEDTVKTNSNCFEELLLNSYPFFKKQLFAQVLQQITQNSKNQFVYTFFNSHFQVLPHHQQIIEEQLTFVKENLSEEMLELKNNLVMILCYNKPLAELKKFIREFSVKNSFRVIPMFNAIRAEFHLTTDPVDSALKYFQQNPKIAFRTSKTTQTRLQAIQQLNQYRDQLLDELHKLISTPSSLSKIQVKQAQVSEGQSQAQLQQQIVLKACTLYKSSQKAQTASMAKISLQTVGTRNKITQLLKLIYSIQSLLKHKVIDYDNTTMKFKSIDPITPRKSLVQNKKFIEVFNAIIAEETYMHDVRLTGILSELMTHELVFNYGNQTRDCKSNVNRDSLTNSYQELPDTYNVYLVMDAFREKIKLLHYANSLNQVKKDRAAWLSQPKTPQQTQSNQQFFYKLLNQAKLLILAPGNQKSISLIKAYLIIVGLRHVNPFILSLFQQTHIQSRFYWQKVNEIFQQFKNYGISFSVQQTVELIDNLGRIFMSKDNKKIKQIAMHSFKYLITLIKQQQNTEEGLIEFNNIEKIEKKLRKYVDHEKLKLIWMLSVNIVLISRKFTNFQSDHDKVKIGKIEEIWDFMRLLEPMIMSQTRIVRRLALFIYSLCFRKVKKIIKVSQQRKVQLKEYTPKTLTHFIDTGYLRQHHISEQNRKVVTPQGRIEYLQFNDNLMKIAPYQQYEVSVINPNSELYQVYRKIEQESFDFILKSQELSVKFITNFHADMVSTAEQLISMAGQGQKQTELSELIVKELEESFYYFVPKRLNFDKVEIFFGQRFFKYLMLKDSKNNFRILFNPKVQQLLQKAALNLQSLDNQALVLIISQDAIFAYQRQYDNFSTEVKEKLEKFVLEVYNEMARRSSGQIFKKWGLIFKRVESQRALQFLLKHMRKEICQEKKRVCRNGVVYLTIKQNDFDQHITVLKVLLENRLQLQNTIVNRIINTILTQPQKYPIDKQLAIKYNFIDFQKQLSSGSLQKSTQRTYFIRNSSFKQYLLQTLRKYITSPNTQTKQIKQKQTYNEFIKNAYALILNAINCFCHSFQSQENVGKIGELIQLIYEMSLDKGETQVIDYQQFQPILKTIFSYQFEDVSNFQIVLNAVMKLIKVLPSKRQVQMLTVILHRPYNFTRLSPEKYQQVIYDIFTLEQTNNNYKELMANLSVILSFRMPPVDKFIDLIAQKAEVNVQGKTQEEKAKILAKNKKTKGKILLLYQCQQLALLKLHKQATAFILSQSPKQRKNIWCREMLALRGKKQYLDDQQTYHIWQTIKANSNPYNYIV